MQIYVQKLSNPSEEWSLDVDPSDTIEGVRQKLHDNEPSFDITKIKLFYASASSTDLQNNQTLSHYNIQKDAVINCYTDVHVSGTFLNQATDPDADVSVYARGLYVINSELFNSEPQWYQNGDESKSRLFYAGAPTIGWILTLEMESSSNSIGSSPLSPNVAPVQLISSDWDASLVPNGIFSSNLVISYTNTDSACGPLYDKFATATETGCNRFRRLWALGYV
jgi:hypothetical protein